MLGIFFHGGEYGGHEKMTLRMMLDLRKNGVAFICFVPSTNRRLYEALEAQGFDIELIELEGNRTDLIFGDFVLVSRSLAGSLQCLLQKFSVRRVLVVNGNAVASHRNTLSLLRVTRSLGLRCSIYIPMLHSSADLGLSAAKGYFYRRAVGRVLRRASDVWVIDSVWRDRVLEAAPAAVTHVIHNFVDRPELPARSRQPAEAHKKNICFVGRMESSQKGLDYFFSILENLETGVRTTIHMVGDGPDMAFVRRRAQEVASSTLAFCLHGWVAKPMEIMRQCDALIMPSRVEGAPLVAIEALMLGVPVFAFDIPGVRGIVEPEYLAPPFDVSEFAAKLGRFLAAGCDPYMCPKHIALYSDEARFSSELMSAYMGAAARCA